MRRLGSAAVNIDGMAMWQAKGSSEQTGIVYEIAHFSGTREGMEAARRYVGSRWK